MHAFRTRRTLTSDRMDQRPPARMAAAGERPAVVSKPPPERPRSGTSWRVVDRVAQANVLIGICLAAMLRLVSSWQEDRSPGEPVAPLPEFLLFVAAGLGAVAGLVICSTQINDFPLRWQRMTAGALTFLVQFTLFQVLMAYIG